MNASDPERRPLNVRRLIGFLVGVVLLGLAIGFALRGVELSVLGEAAAWEFAALGGLVVLNLLLTSLLFWGVTRPFAPVPEVGCRTMAALLAVSGVLNYIPVIRAGLWGRAAYLKKFHGLAVKDSLLILGVVLGLAVSVLGTVCLVLLLLPGETGWWACVGALAVQTFMSGRVWGKALRRPAVGAWMWVPLRTLDLAAAAGRLWLAFGIVGVELTWTDAVLLASATLVVKLVGLTPNGLGLSEWVVAALSAAMMPIGTATAAAAALVDRTVEVGVMLLAGAAGAWWLKREASNHAEDSAAASS
ncbi:hypothetical protein [Algisphaera agarilytica]|uniref:Uncharacterized membrane protein YbhN (UPF0104 family) n=1 Tax=Algisphaera agarilytica TaxID=1385975 RepID=A0A7X0H888_9BACT|nr:hypothetical protein [Algisphaera agarilytica]MBB6431105.1 uncharacterized membrane protein YbhN (UPF0104 family) [Algisphaera agarilytica]